MSHSVLSYSKHFNQAPSGLKRISQKQFARGNYLSYNVNRIEYRQMFVENDNRLISNENYSENKHRINATLYFMDDNRGYAMESDYYAGKVRYYIFGCQHNYQSISPQECYKRNIYHGGRCYNVFECSKCNYISAVDSSD